MTAAKTMEIALQTVAGLRQRWNTKWIDPMQNPVISNQPKNPFNKDSQEGPEPLNWRLVLALEDRLLPTLKALKGFLTAISLVALDQGSISILESHGVSRITDVAQEARSQVQESLRILSDLTLEFPGKPEQIPPLHGLHQQNSMLELPSAQLFVQKVVEGMTVSNRLRDRLLQNYQNIYCQVSAQLVGLNIFILSSCYLLYLE